MADLSAYYRALDLEPGVSMDQVKVAWRDLAQVWHPDRFPNNERLKAKAEEQQYLPDALSGKRFLEDE